MTGVLSIRHWPRQALHAKEQVVSKSLESKGNLLPGAPDIVRRIVCHPNLLIGLILTGGLLTMALVGLVWTPFPPTQMNIPDRLQGPSLIHWAGTDLYGRDIFSMLMVGAGNSILVGTIAVGIGMGIGWMM